MARKIASERMEWASPFAAELRAGVARLHGDAGRACDHLRRAVVGFEAADLALDAAVARFALGREVGGARGAELVDASVAWMTARGVVKPERLLRTFVPWAR
jgi:hypothetical protein